MSEGKEGVLGGWGSRHGLEMDRGPGVVEVHRAKELYGQYMEDIEGWW